MIPSFIQLIGDYSDFKVWSKPIKEELCLSYDLKVGLILLSPKLN